MDNVSKLIIDGMKLSLFNTERIVFQSVVSIDDRSKHIDSRANLTIAGGFAIDLTSANCFFFIPLTAKLKICFYSKNKNKNVNNFFH